MLNFDDPITEANILDVANVTIKGKVKSLDAAVTEDDLIQEAVIKLFEQFIGKPIGSSIWYLRHNMWEREKALKRQNHVNTRSLDGIAENSFHGEGKPVAETTELGVPQESKPIREDGPTIGVDGRWCRKGFIYQGKETDAYALAAKRPHRRLVKDTILARLRRGHDPNILARPVDYYRNRKFMYDGKKRTLKEIGKLSGLKKPALEKRVRDGIPLDAPPGNNSKVCKPNTITHQDTGEILSRTEWSRKLGGNDHLVSVRIYKGWTEQEAIGAVPRNKKALKVAS